MAKKSTPARAYYYAGGEKIELTPADDLFAVESGDTGTVAGASRETGRALTGNLRLVTKDERPKVKGLVGSKLKYPVFRAEGAIVVVLPEVRVEESRKGQRAKLDKWLAKHSDDVTVVSRDDDRLVLSPASGSGADALKMANDLAEEIGPEMAQARFIRVTPRPNTRRGP